MMEYEQIAIVDDEAKIQKMWENEGYEFIMDVVKAKGILLFREGQYKSIENEAALAFNYKIFPGIEFELISYLRGDNFLEGRLNGTVSHFGIHVPSIEDTSRQQFVDYVLLQEVVTINHQSQLVNRNYHYAIYQHREANMRIKLIERIEPEQVQPKLQKILGRLS